MHFTRFIIAAIAISVPLACAAPKVPRSPTPQSLPNTATTTVLQSAVNGMVVTINNAGTGVQGTYVYQDVVSAIQIATIAAVDFKAQGATLAEGSSTIVRNIVNAATGGLGNLKSAFTSIPGLTMEATIPSEAYQAIKPKVDALVVALVDVSHTNCPSCSAEATHNMDVAVTALQAIGSQI